MAAMRDAAPWLRRRLAERLHIRTVPQLTMRRDESIEAGDRVLRLLSQLEEEREGRREDPQE
jgi:ribosome-binding factor A